MTRVGERKIIVADDMNLVEEGMAKSFWPSLLIENEVVFSKVNFVLFSDAKF